MLRYLINLLLNLLPPSRLFWLRNKLLLLVHIETAGNVCFCGGGWIYGRGQLKIGEGTWISPSTVFYTHIEAPIAIGARCDIGPGVKFIPGSHQIGSSSRRAGEGTAKPIVIEEGCWIGAYTLILGGVTIGKGSVIAAGSVVTRDIKENTLAAGVPATIKRELP